METQTLINVAFGCAGAMGGWMLNRIWSNMDKVESQVQSTEQRVHKVEVLVAGQYVKRSEFDAHMERLFDKLEVISTKLDTKVDK